MLVALNSETNWFTDSGSMRYSGMGFITCADTIDTWYTRSGNTGAALTYFAVVCAFAWLLQTLSGRWRARIVA